MASLRPDTDLNFRSSPHYPTNVNSLTLRNYLTGQEFQDVLFQTACENTPCQPQYCGASLMYPYDPEHLERKHREPRSIELITKDAREFIESYYSSLNRPAGQAEKERLGQIMTEIQTSGTYELTTQELAYGAKMAWRNASRCIGRIQWNRLTLFDARYVTTTQQMFEAICNHIRYSNNKGNLRSAITVFPHRIHGRHDFRIWNKQLILYAGYHREDGSVVGDPANAEFTEICQNLGWRGEGTRFDVLPLVLSANEGRPEFYRIPPDIVLEVPIRHPKFKWMRDLSLKWFALPAVSALGLDCGGLEFTAVPFSGWYMSTEIAARNLSDPNRYNILEPVAKCMGLDTSNSRTLWKDKAILEMNIAVLHSFQEAGVTIMDHHTASESFMRFMEADMKMRGGCPADWVWLVPPISGSISPVFHQEMCRYVLKPTFFDQIPAWHNFDWSSLENNIKSGRKHTRHHFKGIVGLVQFTSHLYSDAMSKRIKATILYATETGKSREFAKLLEQAMSHVFNAKAICMDQYDIFGLEHESLLFIVASTFGNGDPPENGEAFYHSLRKTYLSENMENNYQLLTSSSTTVDSCANTRTNIGHISKNKFRHDIKPSLMAPFFRSYSIPKIMHSRAEVTCQGVANVTEPNTPESGPQAEWPWQSEASLTSNGVLANVRYAVFALGSSAYPQYCYFGKKLDAILSDLSAERLLPVTCGDELNGQASKFREWTLQAFRAACEAFCIENDELVKQAGDRLQPDQLADRNTVRLSPAADSADSATDSADAQLKQLTAGLARAHGRAVQQLAVLHSRQLHEERDGRMTISVALTRVCPESQTNDKSNTLSYQPGDHLAILPSNPEKEVLAVLEGMMGDELDTPVQLQIQYKADTAQGTVKKWRPDTRLPCATIKQLLTSYLDIMSPPSQILLQYLAKMAADENEQNSLRELANNSDVYETWKHDCWPSLADIFKQFPSIQPHSALLMHKLPLLQPRLYSISSSLAYRPNEVHLTVAVVVYSTPDGAEHRGVCSNYMLNLQPGDVVMGYIRSASSFHMPESHSASMILIGPGTGLAPYRGFWEQRAYDRQNSSEKSEEFGKMLLFFGCRYRTMNLYSDEKDRMSAEGVLTGNNLALSREKNHKKEYVQDQLLSSSDEVLQVMTSRTGHVYICGDCTMAAGVAATLRQILQHKHGLSDQQAVEHFAQMEREGRFHQDIFGITLRTAEITKKSRAMLSSNTSRGSTG